METLKVNNIVKYFYEPEKFQVLKDVTFSAAKGEFLALVGKSGSGKSTLLYVLSTMDTDYQGNLVINNEVMTGKTQNELSAFRNQHIGFVFQFHYLLPEFTVLENIMIPALKLKRLSWKPSTLKTRPSNRPANSPAASNSAPPSPAPSSTTPPSSWATNPPATWTPGTHKPSSISSGKLQDKAIRPSSPSPTTKTSPPTATAYSNSVMAAW
jgi:ABC-type sugar transport system ATPase subunit